MQASRNSEAKAILSRPVNATGNGEPTLTTRDSGAATTLVPIEVAEQPASSDWPSIADLLLSIPEIEVERDPAPLRPVEL